MSDIKKIHAWLIFCCLMILVMVFIGGLTRSTDSGLSMVDWRIFLGIIPPLNEGDWFNLFNKYKQFPEYKLINQNITLSEFKFIFWMEYAHRIWGRLIFLVILLPFLYFKLYKKIPKKLDKHFMIIILLILFQGFFGWYMVKSGLVENPDVSQYRLSVHLIIAFIIYGYLFYMSLIFYDLKNNIKKTHTKSSLKFPFICLILLISITVLSGGFVAGLDAGLTYNTFPKMGENFIPKYINFFENPITVQFDHRILGTLTLLVILSLWLYIKIKKFPVEFKKKINWLLFAVVFQVILGIATLISFVAIPLALMHQLGSLILLSISLWIFKRLPLVSK